MKPQRRLALHRERLTDLSARDLAGVQGGTHIQTDCGCVTHNYSCDACPVPTLPVNECEVYVNTSLVRKITYAVSLPCP